MGSNTAMAAMAMAVDGGQAKSVEKGGAFYAMACLLVGGLASSSTHAETWQLTTGIRSTATLTDNVALVGANPVSDFVVEAIPNFSLVSTGGRLSYDINYSLDDVQHTAGIGGNRIVHNLASTAKFEAVEKRLYIDVAAQMSQQNISALGVQNGTNANLTSNRSEVKNISISPHIQGPLSSTVNYNLRYRISEIKSDSNLAGTDSSSQDLTGAIRGGSDLTQWQLSFSRNDSSTTNAISSLVTQRTPNKSSTINSIQGSVFLRPDPQLSFSANVGHETNTSYIVGSPDTVTYGAGMQWRPSSLTSFSADVNHKGFGSNYAVSASHRTAWTAWNLNWTRDITSTQNLLLAPNPNLDLLSSLVRNAYSDPERQKLLYSLLGIPPGYVPSLGLVTDQRMLQNVLRGTVAMIGVRNTVTINASRSKSQAATLSGAANDLTTFSNIRMNSWGAAWSLLLSPVSHFTVNYNSSRSEGSGNTPTVESRQRLVSAELSSQLSPKLMASVMLKNSRSEGSQTGTIRENSCVATVGYRF